MVGVLVCWGIHPGCERAVIGSYRPKFRFAGEISDNDALVTWISRRE